MKINIFPKDDYWYDYLSKFNRIIEKSTEGYKFIGHGPNPKLDFANKEVSWWFDPKHVQTLPTVKYWPKTMQFQLRSEFSLLEYAPNYTSIFVIHKLFGDRKNILIEDVACGMSKFGFYLNKLGFYNFNLIDNFNLLPKELILNLWNNVKADWTLNLSDTKPTIVNFISLTEYPKPFDRDNLELLCLDNNSGIAYYHEGNVNQLLFPTLESWGYKFLCMDEFEMTKIYCREDKYEEFSKVLEHFKV